MDAQFTSAFLDKVGRTSLEPEAANTNQTALTAVYDAVIRGDYETFGTLLTDDVELDIRGAGLMDGHWRGRANVVDAVRANFAQVTAQKPEIEGMISQGDSVAMLFRESGVYNRNGKGYSSRVVQWFTFAGGKIQRIDQLVANVASE